MHKMMHANINMVITTTCGDTMLPIQGANAHFQTSSTDIDEPARENRNQPSCKILLALENHMQLNQQKASQNYPLSWTAHTDL